MKAILLLLALAGCASRATTSADGTDGESTGTANFSMCVGFCVHRTGPPLVLQQPAPAPAPTTTRR